MAKDVEWVGDQVVESHHQYTHPGHRFMITYLESPHILILSFFFCTGTSPCLGLNRGDYSLLLQVL